MLMVLVAAVLGAFLLSAIGTRTAMFVARRAAFIDRPGLEPHKHHHRSVPYGGGVAMAAAMAAILLAVHLATRGSSEDQYLALVGNRLAPVYLGALALFIIGVIDDLRPLRALLKFALQATISGAVVWAADFRIDILSDVPPVSYGLAWLWLILVTNAYNLLDHADGLSATVAAISASVLLSGSLIGEQMELSLVWMVLIAVLAGFLCWNLPPARIYMGDAGALPLGFLIGAGTLSVTFWTSDEGGSPLSVLSPLLITAIPLFDTAVVVIKRLRRRKPIMLGDRNHISHRLTRLGMSPRASLGTVAALQLALAAGALQLRDQDLLSGIVVLAQSAGIVLAVVLLETIRDAHE